MALTEQATQTRGKWPLTAKRQPEPAPVVEIYPAPIFSRFSPTTDLIKSGVWVSDRVRQKWSHLNERTVLGWLKGCAESNENLFIKSLHSVSMFRTVHNALDPKPSIEEIFVFVDDPQNKQAINEGAANYGEMRRWAQGMGAERAVVGQNTDIPISMIRSVLGSVETSQLNIAKFL